MRIINLPDAHLEYDRPPHPSYLLAKQVVRDIRPDCLIIGGDMAEMGCFSKWNKKKPRIMEGKRYHADANYIARELEGLRHHTKDMVYLEGNHEDWVNQHLDANPELEGIIDYQRDVGIHDLGITWVPFNGVHTVANVNFIHGWYHNIYHARKTLDDMGGHIIYGHTHDHQVYVKPIRAEREPHIAMSIGCLCDINPHYLRGRPNRWVNGFGIIEVEWSTDLFNPYFVGIYQKNNEWVCTYGGDTWRWKEDANVGYRSKNQSDWTLPIDGHQCLATFRPTTTET